MHKKRFNLVNFLSVYNAGLICALYMKKTMIFTWYVTELTWLFMANLMIFMINKTNYSLMLYDNH